MSIVDRYMRYLGGLILLWQRVVALGGSTPKLTLDFVILKDLGLLNTTERDVLDIAQQRNGLMLADPNDWT